MIDAAGLAALLGATQYIQWQEKVSEPFGIICIYV